MEENRHKNKSIIKRIACILFSLVVLVGMFFAGYYTFYFSLDGSIRSLIWAKNKIDDIYYTDISDSDFLAAAMNGVETLLDPYSAYYTPEEYAETTANMAGNREGFGLSFATSSNRSFIYRVGGNSPAERAGIQSGGTVVGFGLNREEITYTDSYSAFYSFTEGVESGTEVVLAVSPTGEKEDASFYSLAKEAYSENYVFYRSQDTAYRFTGNNALTLTAFDGAEASLPKDTAVIKLTQFAGNAAQQFAFALQVFKQENKTNLVLDLRNNGGGNMDILRPIASHLLKGATDSKPLVATARYKDGHESNFYATGNDFSEYFTQESKIYVLANFNSASASECLLGAMLDYGTIDYSDIYISEIGGSDKTYGKGIMQTTYADLADGGAIKLTSATVHWPLTQTCIHGVGITTADGAIPLHASAIVTVGDEELVDFISLYLK